MKNNLGKMKNYKIYHIIAVAILLVAVVMGQLYSLPNIGVISNVLFKVACCFLVLGDMVALIYKNRIYHSYLYFILFGIFSMFINLSIFCYRGQEQLTANAYIVDFAVTFTFIIAVAQVIRYEGNLLKKLFNWLKQNKLIILICLIYTILFIPCYSVWFKIDSYTYYSSIAENAGTWNFNICNLDGLLMGGHTSFSYSILLQIGELILPYGGYGQRTVNLILTFVMVGAFYKICDFFWGNKGEVYPFLLTTIFSLSPTVLGISYLLSTDFAMLCFITIFVYAYISQNRALKWITGFAVCFSKEIGIIVLAGFYLGECIYQIFTDSKNKSKIKCFFIECFKLGRIVEFSGAIAFVCFALFGNGGWMKNLRNLFAHEASTQPIIENANVWWHYPIFKIFEYFFMNFNWVIFPIMIIAFVSRHVENKHDVEKKADQQRIRYFIPLFFGYALFCASGIAYLTYPHYRYIQAGCLFFVLFLGWVILDYSHLNKRVCIAILVVVNLLFLVATYIMVDPVTLSFFKKFDMGNGQTVSTRQYWYITTNEETGDGYYWEADDSVMSAHYLAEGTEFNLENIGMQKMLEKAITNINYNSNDLIIVDNFGGWSQYTLGQLFGVMKSDGYYWDTNRKTVTRTVTQCPLNVIIDSCTYDASQYENIYYFKFPFNAYYSSSMLDKLSELPEHSVSYGRWKMEVYKVK